MGAGRAVVILLTLVTLMVWAAHSDTDDKVVLSILHPLTEETKNRIRVRSLIFPGNMDTYAAYLNVNDTVDINLFFWLCKAKMDKRGKAPLLLWLNGGPGVTSMVGALLENGPYEMHEDGTVSEREHAWTNEFHMLYVDNPVGVGYSFSSQSFMEENMDSVVQHLYKLLHYFHTTLCPECFKNGLYIGGQSYAGKYVPSLGKFIHLRNLQEAEDSRKIPMRGIYVGAGLCDARTMLPVHADTLYYAGLISRQNRDEYRSVIMTSVSRPNDLQALYATLDVEVNATADGHLESLLSPEVSMSKRLEILKHFMERETTRRAFHVGDYGGNPSYTIFNDTATRDLLRNNVYVDTVDENQLLMDNYKVLHFSGNLDMLVTVSMTEAFLDQVSWRGRDMYRNTPYTKWQQHTQMLGWFATVHNFTRVVVRNAGHNVPFDQPQAALEMMKSFVHDLPPFRSQTSSASTPSTACLLHAGHSCLGGLLAALFCTVLLGRS